MTGTSRLGAFDATSAEQAAADLGARNGSPRRIARVVAHLRPSTLLADRPDST